jgi:hypothetical protein
MVPPEGVNGMTEQIHKGYARSHGTGTEKSKTFWLKDLGSQYKVERTEDWDCCEGDEKSDIVTFPLISIGDTSRMYSRVHPLS